MERTEAGLGGRIQVAQLAVGRAAATSDTVSDFLERVCELAATTAGARGAGFWRLGGAVEGMEWSGSPGRPPECADAAVRLLTAAELVETKEIHAEGDALAVVWREGDTLLGALCVYQPISPGGFTDDDGVVLWAMAYACGSFYGRLERNGRWLQGEERLSRMLEISRTLNSILDPDELIDTFAAQAAAILGCRGGTAGLRRSDGVVSTTFYLDGDAIQFEYHWPPGHGTPGWCLVHREQYVTNDVVHDPQVVPVLSDRFVTERALCTPIVDARGEVLGFVSVYNKPTDFDDDDRRVMLALANHAALALQNALAYRRLGELEQLKSDFLNLAAHELRGPVATARGHLEMLAETQAPWGDGQRRAMLAVAASKLDHIRFLVDQMLTTARLDDQRLQLTLEDADLRRLVERAREEVEYAVKPEHRVRLDLGSEPIVVRVDARRIEAAVANLIENACKYSPDGGDVVVRCQATGAPAWAEVQVEDQGVGIAEQDISRLFTRFGRIVTSENSHVPGSGLGLYLARQLALLHGGDIIVRSEEGQGSRFSLRLPLATPAGEDVQAQRFQREAEQIARRQDEAEVPAAMLPGENPTSPYLQDARHWVVVYQELLKVKEDMLDQLHVRRGQTRAAQAEFDRDGQSLKLEVDRLRTHLNFWRDRAARLERPHPIS